MNMKDIKELRKITVATLACAMLLGQAQGTEQARRIEDEIRINKLMQETFYEQLTLAEGVDDPVVREQRLKTVINCLEKTTCEEKNLIQKHKQSKEFEKTYNELHRKALIKRENEEKINKALGGWKYNHNY
jgi:hypothetical protein